MRYILIANKIINEQKFIVVRMMRGDVEVKSVTMHASEIDEQLVPLVKEWML